MVKRTEEVGEAPRVIPTEEIAEAVIALSQGVKKLLSGRLNKKAIVVLLQDSTSMGRRSIEEVLAALEGLEDRYINKKKKP